MMNSRHCIAYLVISSQSLPARDYNSAVPKIIISVSPIRRRVQFERFVQPTIKETYFCFVFWCEDDQV